METVFLGSSSSRKSHSDLDSCDSRTPNSPTRRALNRLVKSVSKNALKLASALSPRRHHAASSSFFLNSPPPKLFSEKGEGREAMVREELCGVFRHLDGDGDGKISWAELKSGLNSVGEDAGDDELREIVKQLDSDGDGCIDVEEFIRLINSSEERGGAEEVAEKELAAAFRMFEGSSLELGGSRRGRGGITPVGLHRMMCRLGVADDGLTVEDCNFIISQVDLDGDGVVNFYEFKRMMTAAVH